MPGAAARPGSSIYASTTSATPAPGAWCAAVLARASDAGLPGGIGVRLSCVLLDLCSNLASEQRSQGRGASCHHDGDSCAASDGGGSWGCGGSAGSRARVRRRRGLRGEGGGGRAGGEVRWC